MAQQTTLKTKLDSSTGLDLNIRSNWYWGFLIGVIVLTYLAGYQITLMDVDAAQYASISREMAETGNYLEVTNRYQDYLDKPPLLFWFGALFIQILGPHDWAYRLPTLLFALLAAYSIYKYCRFFYPELTARLAGIILLGCQALILTAHDCRTDTILMAAVTFCIWQATSYVKTNRSVNFYGACLGLGMALLAKGPIGAVVPVVALGADWAIKRQWRNILRVEWLSALVVVAALLAPMTYGLYQQWGWHGVKFYYWTQSFGRITGESEWDNGADISFLFTNLLWSFLPWTPWFLVGIYIAFQDLVKRKLRLTEHQEAASIIGFLIPLLMLSTSRYQLPHYSYVLLGLVAVLAARAMVVGNQPPLASKLGWYFAYLLSGFCALLLGLAFYVTDFGTLTWFIWATLVLGWLLKTYLEFRLKAIPLALFTSLVLSICLANITLSSLYYPTILTYQAPTTAVEILADKKIDLDHYITYEFESHAADFYAGTAIPDYRSAKDLARELSPDLSYFILIKDSNLPKLDSIGLKYETVALLQDYHVTKLTLPFLNKATRATKTEPCQIVKTTKVGLAYAQHAVLGSRSRGQH